MSTLLSSIPSPTSFVTMIPGPTSFVTVVTNTTTVPATTLTYSTTYVVLEAGATSSLYTTSKLETTTIPGYTLTSTSTLTIELGVPTTSSTSTSASTGGATPSPIPSGITVVKKGSSSPQTATIVVAVLVPLVVACIIAVIYIKRKHKNGACFVVKHWLRKTETDPERSASLGAPSSPPDIATDHAPFRVASPPRPMRPASISGSILNVMRLSGSDDGGLAPIELAHLRPQRYMDDNGFVGIPDTDGTEMYDGTRNKYLRTALEHNMPLSQLTRSSLRVASAPPKGGRKSSYHPEPLIVHKKSPSDTIANRNANKFDFEGETYPSPLPTEKEFVTNMRANFTKKLPSNHDEDLLGDASSEDGSFIQDHVIARKREESLASLEGRTPATSSSSPWAIGSDGAGVWGRPVPALRAKVRSSEEREREKAEKAVRRKGDVIEEKFLSNFI